MGGPVVATAGPEEAGTGCVRCGYDVRGLAAEIACPECGLGIARTLAKRDRLQECPPGWVRRVAVGTGILLCAAVWVGGVLLYGRVSQAGGLGVDRLLRAMIRPTYPSHEVLFGMGMIVQLAGVWLVTGTEPGKPTAWEVRGWSWVWRGSTAAGIGACVLTAAGHEPWSVTVQVLMLAYAAGPALGFWRLRWLARRIGRPKMAEYAGIVGVGLSALLLERSLVRGDVVYQGVVFSALADFVMRHGLAGDELSSLDEYVRRVAWVLRAVVPAVGIGIVVAWTAGRGRRKAWAGWSAGIWAAASTLAAVESSGEYGRRLWSMVAVLGVLVATTILFYGWGVVLLWRMMMKFGEAAADAERTWEAADAARGEARR